MTAQLVYALVVSVAAVLGFVAGRVLAVEARNRLGALLAGTYVGAGVGLVTGMLLGSLLAVVAELLNEGSSTWFNALDVAAKSLQWGTAGGAAGGLAVSTIIAALNLVRRR